jgi:ATP-binding protein involved in chromosome partitioning
MSVMAGRDEILEALTAVIDPELHRSIVELDMVRSIDIGANGVVDVTVSLTTPGCPIKGHFQTAVAEAASPKERWRRLQTCSASVRARAASASPR